LPAAALSILLAAPRDTSYLLTRNMKLQSNNEENKVLMESIINNNAELQKSNKQQLKEIKAIREEMIELRTTLDKFEGIFKDIRQVLVGTPSKKRKTEVMYIS
jgi:septal ring factor EnvC (AmiA/AmiB activator)